MQQPAQALAMLAQEYGEKLEALVDLLELEQHTLKGREFDNLDAFTRDKQSLLSELEQLDKQRVAITADLEPGTAFSPDHDGRISKLIEKCRNLNNINGGIIEISKQFNQRMLESLLGARGKQENLYDAAGNNNPGQNTKQVVAKI